MDNKWHRRFIKLACEISYWSRDPGSQVGAVIVKDRRILSTGYNGFPSKYNDTEERLNDRETKLLLTTHAEMNAILNAVKFGVSTEGASIYITHHPCITCFNSVISSGITEIYYLINPEFEKRWKNPMIEDLAKEANVILKGMDKWW